jgi:hypothetical protein
MSYDWKLAVESALRRGQVDSALHVLDSVRSREIDQAIPILDHHKDAILKWLLSKIAKYGLNDQLVEYGVHGLRRSRITWPELGIILNSMHKG